MRDLDPFVALANARFHELDAAAALQRLSIEIKSLDIKTAVI